MDALTEYQPWASLQAHGIQTIETRSWPPPARVIGRRIAIHAGKTVIQDPLETGWDTFRAIREIYGDDWPGRVPTGAVVATAVLSRALRVLQLDRRAGTVVAAENGNPERRVELEAEPHGNFAPGRWLWVLEDVRRLEPPRPARGAPGVWQWDPEE